jgi:hypothetical protein
MLWGGLLMLVAFFMVLGFLSRPSHEWGAVLGGIGFGAFIDELGKYLTKDNNYFFQPTIAIIYVTFILIYLAIRVLFALRPMRRHEDLANAFELVKEGSINGLHPEEESTILNLLEHCSEDDPLVTKLKDMLPHIRITPSHQSFILNRVRHRLGSFYQNAIAHSWFAAVVIAFFALTAVVGFSVGIGLVSFRWAVVLGSVASLIILLSLLQIWNSQLPNLQVPLSGGLILVTILAAWAILINPARVSLAFADWAEFIFSSVSAAFVISGIVLMARSRLRAYQMFHRAILVSIFLTTVFAFYEYQFYALIGVLFNTLILFALRYMINFEELKTIDRKEYNTN